MKKMFTAQDIIDMGADLYDNKGFSRADIKLWLVTLVSNGYADVDIERMFDIIVG